MIYKALVGPEGTNKLHEQVAWIPIASLPAALFPLLWSTYGLTGSPFKQFAEVTCWHQSEVDYYSFIVTQSGMSLKDNNKGKSFQWSEHQVAYLAVHFV